MTYTYYEVVGVDGNSICMCGSEADARMMMSLGPNRRWIKRQFLKPDTVNTSAETVEQSVLPPQQKLPEGKQKPFGFH